MWLNGAQALEMGDERREVRHGYDLHSLDEGGLRRVYRRHEDGVKAAFFGQSSHGEDAGGVAYPTVEGEFTDEEGVLDPVRPGLLRSQEDAYSDRQVVSRALFAQISRSPRLTVRRLLG